MRKTVFIPIIFFLLLTVSCGKAGNAPVTTTAADTPAVLTDSVTEPDITEPVITKAISETAPVTETGIPAATEPVSGIDTSGPVYVISPLATADIMEPPEDYSYDREYPIEFIMIHFSSDVKAHPEAPYSVEAVKNTFLANGVSANYIIDREGAVFCFIPENYCAWHAGKGSLFGDERLTNSMNRYSIGIELLAIGSQSDMAKYLKPEKYALIDKSLIGYTEEQYESLSLLIGDLCERYGIERDRRHIIGHSEYSSSGRTDPGELFDWSRIVQ